MKNLQIPLLLVSLLVMIIVLRSIIKNRLNIGYSMIWILWSLSMIVISIFPEIIIFISNILGIQVPSNTTFLITIFLLYCLTFYLYISISKHNKEIVDLNYEIASLKKKLEESEKRK